MSSPTRPRPRSMIGDADWVDFGTAQTFADDATTADTVDAGDPTDSDGGFMVRVVSTTDNGTTGNTDDDQTINGGSVDVDAVDPMASNVSARRQETADLGRGSCGRRLHPGQLERRDEWRNSRLPGRCPGYCRRFRYRAGVDCPGGSGAETDGNGKGGCLGGYHRRLRQEQPLPPPAARVVQPVPSPKTSSQRPSASPSSGCRVPRTPRMTGRSGCAPRRIDLAARE